MTARPGSATAPRSASDRHRDAQHRSGTAPGWSSALLLTGTAGLVLVVPGAGTLGGPAFLVASVGLTVLAARRSPVGGLVVSLSTWFFAPGLRRVVDSVTGFDPNSLVLLAPPLTALALGAVVWPSVRLRSPLRGLAAAFALAVCVAAAVGVLRGAPVVGIAITWLQYLSPLALGVAATAVPGPTLEAALTRIAAVTASVLGAYGIVQFAVVPRWDALWLASVSDVVTSFGSPEPFEIRVFSLLNSPVTLATALAWALLWLLSRPFRWTVLVPVGLGVTTLALSAVRAAWLVLLLGVVVLLVRQQLSRRYLAGAALALVAVVGAGGAAASYVEQRVTSTVSAGAGDLSLNERLAFQAEQFPAALVSPTGEGLGSTGSAVRRSGGSEFADPDSGYLEVLRNVGMPLSLLLVITALPVAALARWRAGTTLGGAAAWVLVVPVYMLFTNVLGGLAGVLVWVTLAALSRAEEGAGGHRHASEPGVVRG